MLRSYKTERTYGISISYKYKLKPMKQIDMMRKRLYYQSHHRGMKEMDVMLGGFAEVVLHLMTFEELCQFEELLAFPDQDLYSWFFEGISVPENAPQKLIERIDDFIKNK